jgi:FixJ family two-component response regulator
MPELAPVVAVVEDDVATRVAFSRLLRAGGFEPAPYESAEAFLAAPPARPPTCLVLDIQLRGMSGLDLQQRLRAERSALPVIVVTASDAPSVRTTSTRLGCTAFLHKGVDGRVILSLIRQLATAAQD